MKKQFIVACSLLLFTTTAAFAQLGNITGESLKAGDMNGAPPKTPDNVVIDRSFKLAVNQPATIGNSAFGGEAKLTLKNNALVMEKTVTEMGKFLIRISGRYGQSRFPVLPTNWNSGQTEICSP